MKKFLVYSISTFVGMLVISNLFTETEQIPNQQELLKATIPTEVETVKEIEVKKQSVPENKTETETKTTLVTPVNTGPEVKMSKSNICHQKGSTYYDQTKYYTIYNSIQDCINAGGKLPKR